MKLPKALSSLLAASLLGLTLSACTAPEPAGPTEPTTIRLVTEPGADYQALAAIYARQLKDRGYQVQLLDPVAASAGLVATQDADLSIAGAASTAKVLQAQAQVPASTAGALSRDSSAQIIQDNSGEQLAALEASAGDLGSVLVMSRAEMALNEIDDFTELAKQCSTFSFSAPEPDLPTLREGLEQAGCTEPQAVANEASQLVDELRSGRIDAVALSQADAVIVDEAFIPVSGSAAQFDSQPVLPLGDSTIIAGPALETINEVTRELDQDTLIAVHRMAHGPEASTAQQIAARWDLLAQ